MILICCEWNWGMWEGKIILFVKGVGGLGVW